MSTQSMQALQIANEIRLEGARIRREMGALPLRESRQKAILLLLDPPEALQRMRVHHFLTGIHRVGRRRATNLLNGAKIRPSAAECIIGPNGETTGRRPLTDGERLRLAQSLEHSLR